MTSKALLIGTTVAMSSPVMARPVNVFVRAENLGNQVIVGNHVYPKVPVGAGSASTEGQGGIIVTTGYRSTVTEPIIGGNGLPAGSVCHNVANHYRDYPAILMDRGQTPDRRQSVSPKCHLPALTFP